MIVVIDTRRPASFGVDVNLQLEAFLGAWSTVLPF